MTKNTPPKILVIKLGAFGDFVQALGPMAAIRKHHPDAHITLLTTKPYEVLAAKSGYFNEIRIDTRPRWSDLKGWLDLMEWLRAGDFTRVYDLQNSQRSSLYFKLFPFRKKPEWVGVAKGASHRNASPERTAGHAFQGHVQTLAFAGVHSVAIDTLNWIDPVTPSFPLRKPFVLLIPGSSPDHPEKRWPARHYGRLAQILAADHFQSVIIGAAGDGDLGEIIRADCPDALDLTGQTSMLDIAALARQAAFCVGNDTGPVHMAAATGCPTLALFSPHSDMTRHAPQGSHVRTLQTKKSLEDLKPEKVLKLFRPRHSSLLPKSALVLH